jgi:hypothetical protein
VVDIAFLIAKDARYPEPAKVVEAAAALGIPLVHDDKQSDPMSFSLRNGGSFLVMAIDAPFPDADGAAHGPTSPPPEELQSAPAHFILTALGLEGDDRERDLSLAALTSCVIATTDSVGAKLGHGTVFHIANLFGEMSQLGVEAGELPTEIIADISIAREDDDRMSFLTHGMQRHGREELYVTCPIQGTGALDFVFSIARWLLDEPDKVLPTGDTLGRTAEEKVQVQRVPNPTGRGDVVIRLDLE